MDDGEFLAELDKLVDDPLVDKPVANHEPLFADHKPDFGEYEPVSEPAPARPHPFDVIGKSRERIPQPATEPKTSDAIHVSRTVAALMVALCVGFGACTAALVFHEQVMQLAAKWTQFGR